MASLYFTTKPEHFFVNMKIAYFTVDDVVKMRAALNHAENALKRLAIENESWKTIFNGELQQVKEAKEALNEAIRREP